MIASFTALVMYYYLSSLGELIQLLIATPRSLIKVSITRLVAS